MGVPATAAASIIDIYDGQSRSKQLAKIGDKRYEATVKASNEGFLRFSEDVRARTSEERAQITAEITQVVSEVITAKGSATAGAAAGGVAGQSVADTLDELSRQAAETGANLSVLQRFRERAAARQIDSARVNTELRNLGALPAPVNRPNLLGGIFKGIAATSQAAAIEGKSET